MKAKLSLFFAFSVVLCAQPLTLAKPTIGVSPQGRPTRTYLGFASTNSAKTTTLTLTSAAAPGDALVVIAFSGNYASSNWTGTVTDSNSDTCPQVQFGVNSTTQFAGAYICPNLGGGATAVTSATFTISGSSSSNATTGLAAYDVNGVGLTIEDIVDTAWQGNGSSGTAITLTGPIVAQEPNSLVIGGTCAAGTVSAGGARYIQDSGVQAPASAANCVDMAVQSVVVPAYAGITMPFTQGTAAWADVAVVLKPLSMSTDGTPHITGNMFNQSNGSGGSGATGGTFTTGVLVEKGPRWILASNPGSAATASVATNASPTGRIAVVDCLGWVLANNGTAIGAAAAANLTLTGSSQGAKITIPVSWQTTAGVMYQPFTMQCGIGAAANPSETWTFAFSANATNLLEGVVMTGYNLISPFTY